MEEAKLRPKPGAAGLWDRLIGPGATRAESTFIALWAVLCAAAVVTYALLAGLGWSALQLAVVAYVALDIGGGAPANSSNSAKGWFHRPGQGFREHFGFVLVHVHPFALALLFPGFGWGTATVVYVYLLVAAAVVLVVPLYLKRPVAFVLYCIVLLAVLYVLNLPSGLEWFVPLYFLKLLVAHLLPEEAYRPSREDWYRNLEANPAMEIRTAGRFFVPSQRFLSETYAEMTEYEKQHPRLARGLSGWLGNPLDGTQEARRRFAESVRMVAFRPENGAP